MADFFMNIDALKNGDADSGNFINKNKNNKINKKMHNFCFDEPVSSGYSDYTPLSRSSSASSRSSSSASYASSASHGVIRTSDSGLTCFSPHY
jgi:hypothetical protein